MRSLTGKRINRINLEPIKTNAANILQPFVFGDQINLDTNIILTLSNNNNISKLLLTNRGTKINIIK